MTDAVPDSDSPIAVSLLIADSATAWSAAGFVVSENVVNLGALTVQLERPISHPQLTFDRPHPSGDSALLGLPWIEEELPAADVDTPNHPNGMTVIDHVVLMASSPAALREALASAHLEIRRERSARIAGNDVIQFFCWAGEVLLEIVAPAADPAAGSAEAGATSPELTIWGIAVVAPDIDETVAWFGDRSSQPRDAVQTGRKIATLRTRELGFGLTVAIMSPHQAG